MCLQPQARPSCRDNLVPAKHPGWNTLWGVCGHGPQHADCAPHWRQIFVSPRWGREARLTSAQEKALESVMSQHNPRGLSHRLWERESPRWALALCSHVFSAAASLRKLWLPTGLRGAPASEQVPLATAISLRWVQLGATDYPGQLNLGVVELRCQRLSPSFL